MGGGLVLRSSLSDGTVACLDARLFQRVLAGPTGKRLFDAHERPMTGLQGRLRTRHICPLINLGSPSSTVNAILPPG
jgi:hypothetical protein